MRVIGMQNNCLNESYFQIGMVQNSFTQKSEEQEKKDLLSISPLGKANQMIESLMKLKQNVIEKKNDLICKTLENGESLESIKSELECFEEQLKNIATQVTQIMAESTTKQTEKQAGSKTSEEEKKDELSAQPLDPILSLSASLDQTKVMSSVRSGIKGKATVLKTEIKLDASRGEASVSKKEELADLQSRAAKLDSRIGGNLAETDDKIQSRNGKTAGQNQTETDQVSAAGGKPDNDSSENQPEPKE